MDTKLAASGYWRLCRVNCFRLWVLYSRQRHMIMLLTMLIPSTHRARWISYTLIDLKWHADRLVWLVIIVSYLLLADCLFANRSFPSSVEHQDRRVCCYFWRCWWAPRWSSEWSEFISYYLINSSHNMSLLGPTVFRGPWNFECEFRDMEFALCRRILTFPWNFAEFEKWPVISTIIGVMSDDWLISHSFYSIHVMSHKFHCIFEKKKNIFFLCC